MAAYNPQQFTNEHEEEDSMQPRQEEQKAIKIDITKIFQELKFLKNKVANLETQLMRERCAFCTENLGNVPCPRTRPLPEL
jgi:hypothetical protein